MKKKNVLFLVIDCLGHRFLAGDQIRKYPFLYHLFNRGTSFSQAVSVSSTTSPSMASMLTGCYPYRHQVNTLAGVRLSPEVPAFADILSRAGYHTYAEVTGPLYPELGISRGFAEYNHRPTTHYLHSEWGTQFAGRLKDGCYREPWFLLLHAWELHAPRQVLPAFDKDKYGVRYTRALHSLDLVLERLFEPFADFGDTIFILTGDHGEQVESSKFDRLLRRAIKKSYDRLSSRGFLEEHWLSVYKRCHLGHGYDLNEELVRVPLLFIDHDGLPEKTELDLQASHVDIAPTVLDLLDLRGGDFRMDGQSLLPVVDNEEAGAEHIAYMQSSGIVLPDPSRWQEGIRYRGMKYIRYQQQAGSGGERLYDLRKDPDERYSISDEKLLNLMRAKLESLKTWEEDPREDIQMSKEEIAEMSLRLKDLGYI